MFSLLLQVNFIGNITKCLGFQEFIWIDFNGMSTHLRIFYTWRLENCTHGILMFFQSFRTWLYGIKYSYIIQIISTVV